MNYITRLLCMCKKLVLCSVLLCAVWGANAQHRQVDSLLTLLHQRPETQQKSKILPALLQYSHSMHRDTLFEYAAQAYYTLRPKLPAEERTHISMALAHAYMQWGWTDSAGHYLTEALQDSLLITRPLYWELKRDYALVLGGNYQIQEALDILLKVAAATAAEADWVSYSATANTIGSVYMATKDMANASKWIMMAKEKMPDNQTSKGVATRAALYTNLMELMVVQKKWTDAANYLYAAEGLYGRAPNLKAQSFLYRNKARLMLAMGHEDSAEIALEQVRTLQQVLGTGGHFIDQNLFFAAFYKAAGYYDKAIAICLHNLKNDSEETLTADSNSVLNSDLLTRLPYYEMLASLYQLTGQQDKYTQMLENILEGKEQLYQTNKAEELASLQAQYELSEKERLLALQKIDLLKKDFLLWSLGGTAGLALVLLLYLFTRYKKKKQTQLQAMLQNAEAEKITLMQTERQRIAHDLHDNLGAYGAAIRNNLRQLHQQQERSEHYMHELDSNVQHMVNELGNTIWVLNQSEKTLTDLYDKLKTWTVKILKSYAHVRCRFEELGKENALLSPVEALQWLYIMQEVVNNALRHSGGTVIGVQLQMENPWQVVVKDNGQGMPKHAAEGNGILSVQNRCQKLGWACSWTTLPEGGTQFALTSK